MRSYFPLAGTANTAGASKFIDPWGMGVGNVTTENNRQTLISAPGKLSYLWGAMQGGLCGAGETLTTTLRVNESNSALTVTWDGDTDYTQLDGSNEVTVAAGDRISWTTVSSNNGSYVNQGMYGGAVFTGDNTAESNICGLSEGNLDNVNTQYLNPSGAATLTTTELDAAAVVPCAGTLRDLYVELTVAPGTSTDRVFTVYKNGTSTGLTCTIANTATTGNDTTNTVTVAAGDKISIEQNPSASAPATSRVMYAMTFVADNDGEFPFMLHENGAIDTALADYATFGVSRNSGWNTDEATKQPVRPPMGVKVKNFYAKIQTAPGAGKSYAFAFRKNSTDTSLAPTISDTNVEANDTTPTEVACFWDRLTIGCTPSGTPAASGVGYFSFCLEEDDNLTNAHRFNMM